MEAQMDNHDGLRNGKEGRKASSAFLPLDGKTSQHCVLLCAAVVGGFC